MRPLLVAFCVLLPLLVQAQPNLPKPGWVFNDSTIPRVDIWIDADSLAAIYASGNERSDHEYPARFAFTRDGLSDTIELVGFRLRGNTSRFSQKKSFKVSINSFISGQKFYGLEKLNLNGEHNDPAIVRSKLCWDLERKLGLPASRSNHVTVYINGNFYGLYIHVEHIDDEFVQEYYGSDAGNLYKCLYPANLDYISNNPNDYKLWSGNRPVYELITNENVADFSGLAHFIDVLNNEPSSTFECAIAEVFNVDAYLRALAVEIYTGHWDNLVFNKNNFYLYENPVTGKMEYISYDMDNTYGVDWIGGDWAKRDIYSWEDPGDSRPIYHRLMAVPKYRNQFTAYFRELLQFTDPAIYFPNIDRLKSNAQTWAAIDPFYPLDYGYSPSDFVDAYTQTIGGHVKYGIKPYIQTRNDSAWAQLENTNATPAFQWVTPTFSGINDSFRVRVGVWDENTPAGAVMHYRINGGTWNMAGGKIQSGEVYWAVPPTQSLATMDWYLEVSDIVGNTGRYPCQGFETLDFSQIPDLYINEFMANNDNFLQDEAGEYEDWLEIYNGGSTAISLSGFTLTDDLGNPAKWAFPDTTISAGGFMLIWADDEGSDGPLHANFKLGKGGEVIGLYMATSSGYLPVDTLTFGQQVTDSSQGCYPDGVRPIIALYPATPGASNVVTGITKFAQPNIRVWPNPASDWITVDVTRTNKADMEVTLIDITGRIALRNSITTGITRIQLPQSITAGVWLLQLSARSKDGAIDKPITRKLVIH